MSKTVNQHNKLKFKARRSVRSKKNIGLDVQPVSIKGYNYGYGQNNTELIKLDLESLTTHVVETFNFINGSRALDSIIDVLEPTGELEIDFEDYIGKKMLVEIVEVGRFRNIVSADILVEEDEVLPNAEVSDDELEFYFESEEDQSEIDLEDFFDDEEQ